MDDPKAVLASLPSPAFKHAAKVKEIRTQWNTDCALILQKSRLPQDLKVKVVMDWLHKAGVREFVLGKLVMSFAKPLPPKPTEEQRKERTQKTLVRLTYQDDIPHLRAVNKVVTNRLETVPAGMRSGSFKTIDEVDGRPTDEMFAEFVQHIDDQAAIEYQGNDDNVPFENAAE
jgi:hypothetical protein